jgi:hypothetical protein
MEREAAELAMRVELMLPEEAQLHPGNLEGDVPYQLGFRITGRAYEVRCSLFPQSYLLRQSQNGEIGRYVPLFVQGLMACIAQQDLPRTRSSELPMESVRREFGADVGFTALLQGGNSEFSRGFQYVVLNALYKRGKGVVVVCILFNDPEELDGIEFSKSYYCFAFR